MLKQLCILSCLILFSCENSPVQYSQQDDYYTIDLPFIPYSVVKEKNNLLPECDDGWDPHIREIGNVIKGHDGKYKMFYTAFDCDYEENNVYIGVAESKDGKDWSRLGKILERSSEDPYCIFHNGIYYLYVEDKEDVPFRDIRLYTSTDLEEWQDQGEVLVNVPETWEDTDVSSPAIIIDNGIWYMLYEGRDALHKYKQYGAIGLATSTDGYTWEKYENNPVIVPNNYYFNDIKEYNLLWAKSAVPDDIIKVENTFYFLFHGHEFEKFFKPGMMVSKDLKYWKDATGKPIEYEDFPHGGTLMFLPFTNPCDNYLPNEVIYTDTESILSAIPSSN